MGTSGLHYDEKRLQNWKWGCQCFPLREAQYEMGAIFFATRFVSPASQPIRHNLIQTFQVGGRFQALSKRFFQHSPKSKVQMHLCIKLV